MRCFTVIGSTHSIYSNAEELHMYHACYMQPTGSPYMHVSMYLETCMDFRHFSCTCCMHIHEYYHACLCQHACHILIPKTGMHVTCMVYAVTMVTAISSDYHPAMRSITDYLGTRTVCRTVVHTHTLTTALTYQTIPHCYIKFQFVFRKWYA